MNYRFLTTETNSKALYIYIHILLFVRNLVSKAICSECTDFVYNCVFQKKEKQHSLNLSDFENESTF